MDISIEVLNSWHNEKIINYEIMKYLHKYSLTQELVYECLKYNITNITYFIGYYHFDLMEMIKKIENETNEDKYDKIVDSRKFRLFI